MRAFDVSKMTKEELVWLANHSCKHGHKYLNHYRCYLRERNRTTAEKIGFLDIESSDLNAQFGFVFSYAIKPLGSKDILGRVITPDEVRSGVRDAILMKECVSDIVKFDRLIVYWGKNKRFDVPMIRSRCLKHRIWFPTYKDLMVTDVYDMVKTKLRLKRNGLANVCDFLDIPAKNHPLEPDVWMSALSGDKAALDYIWEHNLEDVVSTELVWRRLHEFQAPQKASI